MLTIPSSFLLQALPRGTEDYRSGRRIAIASEPLHCRSFHPENKSTAVIPGLEKVRDLCGLRSCTGTATSRAGNDHPLLAARKGGWSRVGSGPGAVARHFNTAAFACGVRVQSSCSCASLRAPRRNGRQRRQQVAGPSVSTLQRARCPRGKLGPPSCRNTSRNYF